MKVLVTGADQHQGLAVIRGLGLAGIPVVACGASKRSLGFYSRFAVARARYISPLESPSGFIEDIVRTVQQTGASVVMPVVESTLVALNEWRAEIERYATLAAPSPDLLEYALDKGKTIGLARRVGVPTPRTVAGQNMDDVLFRARELRFPVAIKPRGNGLHRTTANTLGFKVRYAGNMAGLREQLERCEGNIGALLVQEYVSGVGRCVAAVCRHGEPLALLAYSREREVPLSGGVSVVRRSIPLEPVLARYATALLREIAWHGVAMVEFKYDTCARASEGCYTLMEINGRFQASTALSLDAGLNLPHLVACLYQDTDTQAPHSQALPLYRVGIQARWLRGDLLALRDAISLGVVRSLPMGPVRPQPSRLRVVWNFLRDFRPGMHHDEFKWYDWKPGVVECGALISMIARWSIEWIRHVAGRVLRAFSWRSRGPALSPDQQSIRASALPPTVSGPPNVSAAPRARTPDVP